MKIQALDREDVFRELDTTPQGLTEEEARKRLSDFGENIISEKKRASRLVQFASHLADWLGNDTSMRNLAYALFAVIFINALFTFFQEYRAEKASEALKN
ncbi:cation-transporting P-type ATPase [Candidatus Methanoperedens nitratireducens]|uniref:Cation-transporting P-type ATPase N-terminal domain-containing protein n=1 Tax=Candidatus Methanoperedens nitratireducens TaxID=1392998 RepID=A0A284VJ93_9EURY|nr:cation-transporting P-type ATPase [Candidatus Methanoperedens nitroreducens]SNQ59321.1 hypothetical protein MNV_1140017 [Candidatus Methanoperedens nitroreducens]